MMPSKKSLRYALSVYICVCMFVCVYFEFYTSVDKGVTYSDVCGFVSSRDAEQT